MDSNTTEALIMKYWRSWQDHDWTTMRSCLADEIVFGGHSMPADQLVTLSENGTPWRDVQMISSLFMNDRGAILYEGTETTGGKVIRVAEFIQVQDGKIMASNACFGSGQPPL